MPEQKETVATLPLHFVEGFPTVPVVVGGEAVEVMLDLGGADGLALSPDKLEAMGRPTGRSHRFRNVRGDVMTRREFVLPEVRLGELVLGDVHAYEHRFAPDFAPPVRTGYLGLGILRRFVVEIDYARARARLASAVTAEEDKRWAWVPLDSTRDGAVVSLDADGHRLTALLDTGAARSFIRPSATVGLKAGQQSYEVHDVRIGNVDVGPMEFDVQDFAQPAVNAFFGGDFFQKRAVVIDFARNRLGLETR